MDEYESIDLEMDDCGDGDAGDLAGDPAAEGDEPRRRHGSGRRSRRAQDAIEARQAQIAMDNAPPDDTAHNEALDRMGPAMDPDDLAFLMEL